MHINVFLVERSGCNDVKYCMPQYTASLARIADELGYTSVSRMSSPGSRFKVYVTYPRLGVAVVIERITGAALKLQV